MPDESGFYFVSNENSDLDHLRFYEVAGAAHKEVFSLGHEIESVSVTWGGDFISLSVNEDGYSRLKILETEGLCLVEGQNLPDGMIVRPNWSKDGSLLVFGFNDARHNGDIWAWDREVDKYWQVTTSPMGVDAADLVYPEVIHYQSFDGLEVPAFLYKPHGVEKPPAIINIHGGPESQFRPSFNSLIQYFVHHGYAVVAPNVRGSSGYGKHYMALDDVDKRMDSVKDLVALHGYLADQGEVDCQKLALMGGSYGGYMVLAGMAFYPELWAAGVDIVGIANLVTFLENTSSYRRALREAEYGSLEKDRDLLESLSPITRAADIKAPLFIIHGANDPRVPLSEAEQIRDELKRLGQKVELLVYHDEGHGLSKLKNRLDAYPKVADFLDTVLK